MVALAGAVFWSGLSAVAQTPLTNLVFTVGTTIQDNGAQNWSYVLLGSPQANLLAGKQFAFYSKSGYPTNAGSYALRGTIFQQSSSAAINTLLNQSVSLGEDLTTLSNVLNTLLASVPGITNQTLAQKIATGFQVAAVDANTAQILALVERMHPGLTLCAGQAFAEPISTTTSYEVREVNPGTGMAGDVVGRVTIVPGSPVVLPPPGPPFQVVTNDPTLDNLRIRLRWGTPDALRRLSLLSFGYNVWRISLANAQASGYDLNPPMFPAQLYGDPHFTRVNQHPATTSKDFSPAGASDPTDPVTVFFTDDNGHSPGTAHFTNSPPPGYLMPAFNDGDQFYYFITARDVLGRDGLVSPPGLAQACRRLPPLAPTGVRVANATILTNQPRLLVSWQQNTNATDAVAEYWVYRWPNPSMVYTNDAAPLTNRVGVVAQAANTNLNTFLDNNPDSPTAPGASNFWYTVRAVSHGACVVNLLSPHSGPAWGVVRQRRAPDPATGQVFGSCGTPAVMFQNFNALTNADGPDTVNWNYRFTCLRRDPGIAWVQFTIVDRLNNTTNTLAQINLATYDTAAQADYSLPITGNGANYSNDVSCIVGTYYGPVSLPATAHFTTVVSSTGRQEAVFLAGQLLETALDPNDPLLLTLNGSSLYCLPALNPTPDPSGTVHMSFNGYSGTPMLIQVQVSNTWTSLGLHFPDSNGLYWVSYPACLVGPLPPFQGCVVNNLPAGNSDCDQHVPRAAYNGPLAPIHVRFMPTLRTKEYRLYRSVDGGPLTLMAQGTAPYDPLNPQKQVVRTDDAMPPSAARLCYFVQVLDENGNGSPLAVLGCKEVEPPYPPQPVLAEPQAAGSNAAPQVTLNWFCPTSGVYRFEVMIGRDDQPGSGQPSGLASSQLRRVPNYNPTSRFAGLLHAVHVTTPVNTLPVRRVRPLLQFDEAHLTPPVGPNFGPGPQFTLTAGLLANVPYHIAVAAVSDEGHAGPPSVAWNFTWVPPTNLPTVPWPARPLPPATTFDEDVPYSRVQAAVFQGGIFLNGLPIGLGDYRYPVGICIGDFSSLPPSAQISYNAGTTNLLSYSFGYLQGVNPDPNLLVFRRLSGDPTRRGDPLLPIVVYRQQVTNAAFPVVSGHLTQVTPLIESIPWSVTNYPSTQVTVKDRLIVGGSITTFQSDYPIPPALYLRDQQPVILGASYQYFVVRLNDQREVAEVINAGAVTIPSSP